MTKTDPVNWLTAQADPAMSLAMGVIKAALILVCEAEDVCEDGTQPRLGACVKAFWEAFAWFDPEYRPRPAPLPDR
jgi:hypothetical protein